MGSLRTRRVGPSFGPALRQALYSSPVDCPASRPLRAAFFRQGALRMAAITPIPEADLEFDNGSFDSAAFAAHVLSSWQTLAAVIDHTLLKPGATRDQVESLCHEAIRYRFACAMVNPVWVPAAVAVLSGTGIPVGAVIGFPLGASLVSTLRQEAAAVTRLGACELDMVIPIGQLKSGNHHAVHHAVHAVAAVAHHNGALLKAILENSLLSMEE